VRRPILRSLAIAVLAAVIPSPAAIVTFESATLGTAPSYTEVGVFFQAEDGTGIEIADALLDGSIRRVIFSEDVPFKPLRAELPAAAGFVSVVLGDASDDDDSMFLQGYSSTDDLLAEDTDFLSGTGTLTLSISAPGIAYVIFGSSSTINGSSVVADTLEFDTAQIPEPSSLTMMVCAAVGWIAFRKRARCGARTLTCRVATHGDAWPRRQTLAPQWPKDQAIEG
jgi:hypothetical protein